jgi:hypothetical protein
MSAFASTLFSFTPGFSPVERHFAFVRNRFNGFHNKSRGKPLKRFLSRPRVEHRAKARCLEFGRY